MHIQVINFGISVSQEDFVSEAEGVAPVFASMPGLIRKYWLGDEDKGVYGGVYIWENKAACEAYKNGEVFGAVMNSMGFVNPTSEDFEVIESLTRMTT
jgi:heme-degrading monooxygenase HmoA